MKNATAQNPAQMQISTAPPAAASPGSEVISATALEGAPVLNAQEEEIGQVSHIMIDVHAGDVAYIVISSNKVPGIGNKLRAIPRASLIFDAAHNRFILDIDHERLENAPSFDKEHWPIMSDQEWGTQIHDYYGQRNYWLRPSGQQGQFS